MTNASSLRPEQQLAAHRTGLWTAALVLAWAIAMATLDLGLAPLTYWLTFAAGTVVLCCVPAWLLGRSVRRQHLAK